jgi:copper homeostasis protein
LPFLQSKLNLVKIELCVSSIEAILAAVDLNFDRIEICANLEQGGLTPSSGFIQTALSHNIETHVLIRPRTGGFVYTPKEIELILAEIEEVSKLDVKGIVVGVLDERMRLNHDALKEIRSVWGDRDITFHRAFDDLIEWKQELSWLMDQGFSRVLSSGVSRSIENGIPNLAEMKKHASGKIEIMAGGGINLANIGPILKNAKPDAIHFSGTAKKSVDPDSLFSENRLVFDSSKASKLLQSCRNFM